MNCIIVEYIPERKRITSDDAKILVSQPYACIFSDIGIKLDFSAVPTTTSISPGFMFAWYACFHPFQSFCDPTAVEIHFKATNVKASVFKR